MFPQKVKEMQAPVILCLYVMVLNSPNPFVTDPFDAIEPNPNLSNALESSLWEIYSHKKHYHSGVSTLVKIFEEAFTKPGYAMEDFLDHGYGTVSLDPHFM